MTGVPTHLKDNVVGYVAVLLLTGYATLVGPPSSGVEALAERAKLREARMTAIETTAKTATERLHHLDVRLAGIEVRQLSMQDTIKMLQSLHPAQIGKAIP